MNIKFTHQIKLDDNFTNLDYIVSFFKPHMTKGEAQVVPPL